MRVYFLVVAILVFFLFSCGQKSPVKDSAQAISAAALTVQKVDAKGFKACIDSLKDFQLVDVRTPEEYNSGHLKDAFNNDIYHDEFMKRCESLDKNKAVLVYCKAGSRSAEAAEKLRGAGFLHVIDMEGGIMAWQNNNFPLESVTAAPVDSFTEADFKKIISGNTPVLFDFYAKWCIPCKKMEPVLEKLKNEFSGKIIVMRINVDEAKELSKKQEVTSLPVIKTFKEGKEQKAVQGFQSEEQLRTLIEELLK